MTNHKLLAAAAFSLALAGPAAAASVKDFDHFNFGIARPTYHSGWGGPYGDGDYPGSVDQNMGPPYRGSH
jgi:hypothetical protein